MKFLETDMPLFLKSLKHHLIRFMSLFGLKHLGFTRKRKDDNVSGPDAIDGAEKRKEPLSTLNITYYFCKYSDLKTAKYIQTIAYELGVPEATVIEDLRQYLDGIDEATECCIEYPYIEEYYRDTYYSFYARKHNDYNRHCFRISFFSQGVTEDNFFSIELNDKFLGYIVLRPTPRRIIGYSFLSPKTFQAHEIAICICKRLISVMGRSLEVVGFPFLSHDGEAISCSENSIILVFDYFSRRYNNYARALPSQISKLSSHNSCRYQPSVGLAPEEVDQVFNSLGMTTRMYTRKDEDPSKYDFEFPTPEFERLLRIFVESGVPVYVSSPEHAYLLIGRENKLFEQGAKFVVMDGNKRPYHTKDNIDEIDAFIVPMPDNILLDAHLVAPEKFYATIDNLNPQIKMCDKHRTQYIHRIFLTTARSYKKHIVESELDKNDKMLMACVTMPKFVWVCESISINELGKPANDVYVESIGVYDATDYPTERNHLLFAKSKEYLIVPATDTSKLRQKTYNIFKCNAELTTFQYNLKGHHTKWQG